MYVFFFVERERLHTEVVKLRSRNTALRRLIGGVLPELPVAPPKYNRLTPTAFTATYPDEAPVAFAKLPPI